ncbi:MAG: NnrS family protein [Candidatus Omnitrophota bacterium]|nr:NnrS family protein [Candidatus Omnitrophota bacterium]
MNPKNGWIVAVCREPYRIFFPIGVLIGIFGAGHWLVYGLGWAEAYSGIWHSRLQMQGYMGSVIVGFLLTALPRFSGKPHASPIELIVFLAAMGGVFGFRLANRPAPADLSFAVLLCAFAVFMVRRLFMPSRSSNPVSPPVGFIWVPIAGAFGLLGSFLLYAPRFLPISASWANTGRGMLEQGFIFSIVVGVGGFLAPRLMGRSEVVQRADVGKPHVAVLRRKRQIRIAFAGGGVLLLSFLLEGVLGTSIAYSVRALLVTFFFYQNRAWPFPPKIQDDPIRLLWFSIWFMVIGYWMIALVPDLRKAALHLVFLGGYSLMTFAVATVVVLSHSGKPEVLRKPIRALRVVGVGMIAAVFLRLAAVFFPASYFQWLAGAAGLWILCAFVWLVFAGPWLVMVPNADAFEKGHEEAKSRIPPFSRTL